MKTSWSKSWTDGIRYLARFR